MVSLMRATARTDCGRSCKAAVRLLGWFGPALAVHSGSGRAARSWPWSPAQEPGRPVRWPCECGSGAQCVAWGITNRLSGRALVDAYDHGYADAERFANEEISRLPK